MSAMTEAHHRSMAPGSPKANRTAERRHTGLEAGGGEGDGATKGGQLVTLLRGDSQQSQSLVSGGVYCLASASMVLMNKLVLSSYDFNCPNSLLLFQTVACVFLVQMCKLFGMVKLEGFRLNVARVWFPVNVIFVGMIWSGFYSLKFLGVAMVTVLKNMTNLITICGDTFVYGRKYSVYVWLSLVLMIASAFTAAYALYLRSVMDKVSMLTVKQGGMDEFSMVFYNNLLSIPLILCLMVYFEEFTGDNAFWRQPSLNDPVFCLAVCISGMLGFAISFASLWFLSKSTPTTYSLVGSLNKIPISIIGLVIFKTPTSVNNLLSIMVGLFAGVVFAYAKAVDRPAAAPMQQSKTTS